MQQNKWIITCDSDHSLALLPLFGDVNDGDLSSQVTSAFNQHSNTAIVKQVIHRSPLQCPSLEFLLSDYLILLFFFLNHEKELSFPFFPFFTTSQGSLGKFFFTYLSVSYCVRSKSSLSVSLPPTLCYLTWLCVLCRHTRLLHISQSAAPRQRHQGGILPVFRERLMGQERGELTTFFVPEGSKQTITPAGERKEKEWTYSGLIY